jgi:hypothetical protein
MASILELSEKTESEKKEIKDSEYVVTTLQNLTNLLAKIYWTRLIVLTILILVCVNALQKANTNEILPKRQAYYEILNKYSNENPLSGIKSVGEFFEKLPDSNKLRDELFEKQKDYYQALKNEFTGNFSLLGTNITINTDFWLNLLPFLFILTELYVQILHYKRRFLREVSNKLLLNGLKPSIQDKINFGTSDKGTSAFASYPFQLDIIINYSHSLLFALYLVYITISLNFYPFILQPDTYLLLLFIFSIYCYLYLRRVKNRLNRQLLEVGIVTKRNFFEKTRHNIYVIFNLIKRRHYLIIIYVCSIYLIYLYVKENDYTQTYYAIVALFAKFTDFRVLGVASYLVGLTQKFAYALPAFLSICILPLYQIYKFKRPNIILILYSISVFSFTFYFINRAIYFTAFILNTFYSPNKSMGVNINFAEGLSILPIVITFILWFYFRFANKYSYRKQWVRFNNLLAKILIFILIVDILWFLLELPNSFDYGLILYKSFLIALAFIVTGYKQLFGKVNKTVLKDNKTRKNSKKKAVESSES